MTTGPLEETVRSRIRYLTNKGAQVGRYRPSADDRELDVQSRLLRSLTAGQPGTRTATRSSTTMTRQGNLACHACPARFSRLSDWEGHAAATGHDARGGHRRAVTARSASSARSPLFNVSDLGGYYQRAAVNP